MYKGIHTIPKGINPKINVIARPKFELTYYECLFVTASHQTGLDTRSMTWRSIIVGG